MDKRTVSFTLAAFALGCALAWLAKAPDTDAKHPQETAPHRAAPPSRPGTSPVAHRQTATSFQNLDSKEMPRFLNSIEANTGMLLNWNSDQYRLFHEALAHWSENDPESAIHWVMTWRNETDRAHLFQFIIASQAKKSVAGGLALLEKIESISGEKIAAFDSLVKAAMLTDAATFLKVIEKFAGALHPADHGFAPDFDFKTAIEGMIEINEKAAPNDGNKSRLQVSNIVSEWTKRDPQAALDWIQASGSPPPGGWAQFARGYAEVAGLSELGGLAADLQRNGQEGYKGAWQLLSGGGKIPAIDRYFEEISAGGDVVPHARELFIEAMIASKTKNGHSYLNYESTDHLLSLMPPADRLEILTETYRNSTDKSIGGYLQKRITATMTDLGHSEAEIDAVLKR